MMRTTHEMAADTGTIKTRDYHKETRLRDRSNDAEVVQACSHHAYSVAQAVLRGPGGAAVSFSPLVLPLTVEKPQGQYMFLPSCLFLVKSPKLLNNY